MNRIITKLVLITSLFLVGCDNDSMSTFIAPDPIDIP